MSEPASAESPLRAIPSVDEMLREERLQAVCERAPRALVLNAVRETLAAVRARLRASEEPGAGPVPSKAELVAAVEDLVRRAGRPQLVRAVNATGVVLHTGLGRAPLSPEARAALDEVARGYSVLEIDRETGERGERERACAVLLSELTGAEAATVVNNNAAACLLALAALARGRDVIVARGELVEIGGSFRIPDILAESGARLTEVGATNKVRISDYERAIGPETAAILKVHTSNFKVLGFHEEVALGPLARLAHDRGILALQDLGSGNLVDLGALGLEPEPLVRESVEAGADVVTFSGDKLLGGPQAGLVVGAKDPIARMRRHPLFRAVRPDKLTLAALEATLRLFRSDDAARRVTALRLLAAPREAIEARARALASSLASLRPRLDLEVVPTDARVGSGALPLAEVPSFGLAIAIEGCSADSLARALREAEPPVFARISEGRVVIDLRTVLEGEESEVAAAVRRALQGEGGPPVEPSAPLR